MYKVCYDHQFLHVFVEEWFCEYLLCVSLSLCSADWENQISWLRSGVGVVDMKMIEGRIFSQKHKFD